jgi:hypothetical protein
MNHRSWVGIAFLAGIAAGYFMTSLSPNGSWAFNNLYMNGQTLATNF